MSLRIKILTLLVGIPSLCLGVFLYFAITTFENDKKISLFENQFNLLNSINLLFINKEQNLESLSQSLLDLKKQDGFENLVIFTNNGQLWPSLEQNMETVLGSDVYQKLLSQNSTEGSFKASGKDQKTILLSFLKVPFKDADPLLFIITTPESLANRASLLFLFKATATFMALISISILISIQFSNRITNGINALSLAMTAFGAGSIHKNDNADFINDNNSMGDISTNEKKMDADFEIKRLIENQSPDEVTKMANEFLSMKKEIINLISEKEEKTKIETEMNLAGQLQKNFFPDSIYNTDQTEFAGFFQPASHAGGDWWYYFKKENLFVFLIGDVTGHGLNSAMLTGAARAAISLISDTFDSPAEALTRINKVICDTAQSKLMMTCALAALDIASGEITIANASHEVPFLVPAQNKDLRKNDFTFLISEPGPRLGQTKDAKYINTKFKIRNNEFLVFFSDGLIDIQDPNGKSFNERNLYKVVGTNHKESQSAQELLEKIRRPVLQFKSTAELVDDLSFFTVKWKSKI